MSDPRLWKEDDWNKHTSHLGEEDHSVFTQNILETIIDAEQGNFDNIVGGGDSIDGFDGLAEA